VVGGSVPLISLFIVSRILVAFSSYQNPRLAPPRKISHSQAASIGALCLFGIGGATFGLSGIIFALLRIPDASRHAAAAGFACLLMGVGALLISVLSVIRPLLPTAGQLRKALVLLGEGVSEVLGRFLYFPTSIAMRVPPLKPRSI
jgi:hypothetical protein